MSETTTGRTASEDMYCLGADCTSQACKDFQQGWADGRADLLTDLDTELRKFLKEHRGY